MNRLYRRRIPESLGTSSSEQIKEFVSVVANQLDQANSTFDEFSEKLVAELQR
ncbi:MAG: hypothetical protein ACYCPP_04880 [Nitrososphaerales archaeon]